VTCSESDKTPRSSFTGIKRMISCNLPLLFLAALPLLLFSPSVNAEPSGVAVIINEDPSNPQGERHPGTVTWRTDRVKAAPGQPGEPVIHADVEIPDMKLTMAMDIKRNTDKSLPASHVVEMKFVSRRDAAGSAVISVPGMMLKFTEQARGTPLAALSVKITDGSFLVGLSNSESDRSRNLQLLKERSWFDIPIVYANQHRGILAVQKGFHGEEVFFEAMTAWERPQ
jgi:hypothetical protein